MHHAKKRKEKKTDTSSLWSVNIILLIVNQKAAKQSQQTKQHSEYRPETTTWKYKQHTDLNKHKHRHKHTTDKTKTTSADKNNKHKMLANLRVQLRLRDEAKGSTYHQLKFHLSSSLGTSFRLKLTAVEGRSSPFHKRLRCFFMWPHIALNLSYGTPQRAHSYCTRGKFKSGMWALALAMAPPATLCLLEFLVFGKVDALWPALIGPGLCCVWLGGNWKSVGFPMVVFLCSNMVTWKNVKGNERGCGLVISLFLQ